MDNNREGNPISRLFDYVGAILINQLVAPIALFLLVITLFALLLLAFGRDEFLGQSGKLIVGIFVPLFLIKCVISKRFGNAMFAAWVFLLYVIFILIPLLGLLYICLKPAYEYLK